MSGEQHATETPGRGLWRLGAPVATSVLFAGSFVAAHYAIDELGPLSATLLRYLVAMTFLAGLLPFGRGRSLALRRADLGLVVLLGLFGIVGYHYFFFSALRYTAVANTAIINALSPLLTAVLAALLLRERLSIRSYAGVVVAVAGVVVLLCRGEVTRLAALSFNVGDGLMLLAVVSWALYALLVKSLSRSYGSYSLTLYATLSGVVILVFLALGEDYAGAVRGLSTRALWALLYMGVAASGLGYLLYNVSIAEIGPTRTAAIVYSLVPVTVTVMAWLVLGEGVTPPTVASILLVLLGLWLVLGSSLQGPEEQ